jgi:nucleoside-diphosphate-sugar epimerase
MKEYNSDYDKIKNIENSILNYCSIALNFHSKSKILYCSSGAVYGKQPLNIETIEESFEFRQDLSDFPVEKRNYCLSKRHAEQEIINLGNKGLKVSIARCFAFYGKYLPKDQHYAYGNFIGKAEKGEDIIVRATGVVYRSYMEADELVLSLFEILQISSIKCPILNVGSDTTITLEQLAKKIANEYNVNYSCPNLNKNIILDRYVPNITKLKNLLNRIQRNKEL